MERIAVDVTPAITGRTGIARYVTEVVAAMRSAAPETDLACFAIGRGVQPAPADARHVRVPLSLIDRAWKLAGAPTVERLVGSVGSVHASGSLLPPARAPIVAVVHDLAPLDHPELHPARSTQHLRRYLGELERASAVIAVSHATAGQLARHGVAPEKITVVPNGASIFPEPVPSPLHGQRYVLAVGAPVPRKDFATLLEAMALVDDDVRVAIVGPPGSDDDALRQLASARGLTHRLHRVGPVTDAELAGWYASACLLAAPSVEEGFGLPLVEAMLAGVPVVASDIGVFREVTDGHAALVPVGDAHAFADAINTALVRPSELAITIAAARGHASRYTWEACAEATLAVHRSVQR